MIPMFPISLDTIAYVTSFLFVFAIVYGLLIAIKIIESKQACAIIAIVIGFFSVVYSPFVMLLQSILPIGSLMLVILFFIAFIVKFIGISGKKAGRKDALPIVVTLAILLLLLGIFWPTIGNYIPFSIGVENVLWIVGIIIIAMIFYAVYTHEGQIQKQRSGQD